MTALSQGGPARESEGRTCSRRRLIRAITIGEIYCKLFSGGAYCTQTDPAGATPTFVGDGFEPSHLRQRVGGPDWSPTTAIEFQGMANCS